MQVLVEVPGVEAWVLLELEQAGKLGSWQGLDLAEACFAVGLAGKALDWLAEVETC